MDKRFGNMNRESVHIKSPWTGAQGTTDAPKGRKLNHCRSSREKRTEEKRRSGLYIITAIMPRRYYSFLGLHIFQPPRCK